MSVIALDFETSGLNPYQADVLEIGAKVMGEEETFDTLIKPKSGNRIEYKITEITGISPKLLYREGEHWKNAFSAFYNWLISHLKRDKTNVIVSHNGEGFDFIFLKRILLEMKTEMGQDVSGFNDFDIVYLDTLLLSHRLLCNVWCHTQENLCRLLKTPIYPAHRALNDVFALEGVYERLLQILSKNYAVDPEAVWAYIHLDL
jgi:DNA polymerase III alpha subunit (gram-positive type)